MLATVLCVVVCFCCALALTSITFAQGKDGDVNTVFYTTELPVETSIIPYGAPDTGFGGSVQLHKMDSNGALPLLLMVLILLVGFGVLQAVQDWRGKRETI